MPSLTTCTTMPWAWAAATKPAKPGSISMVSRWARSSASSMSSSATWPFMHSREPISPRSQASSSSCQPGLPKRLSRVSVTSSRLIVPSKSLCTIQPGAAVSRYRGMRLFMKLHPYVLTHAHGGGRSLLEDQHALDDTHRPALLVVLQPRRAIDGADAQHACRGQLLLCGAIGVQRHRGPHAFAHGGGEAFIDFGAHLQRALRQEHHGRRAGHG